MSDLTTLLSVLLSLSLSCNLALSDHTPLMHCQQPPFGVKEWPTRCISLCPADQKMIPCSVNLYSINPKNILSRVLQCKKTLTSEIFTRSWTFSDSRSGVTHEALPISASSAQEHVRQNCPDYNCHETVPSEVIAEYHWASETTISSTDITCSKYKAEVGMSADGLIVRIPGAGWVHHSLGSVSISSLEVLVWHPSDIPPDYSCPFIPTATISCITTLSTYNASYHCPKEGIQLLAYRNFSSYHCPQLYVTDDGIVFSDNSTFKFKGEDRVGISADEISGTEQKFLAATINHLIKLLSIDSCHARCAISTLQISATTAYQHEWQLFLTYALRWRDNNTLQLCTPLMHCTMPENSSYCAEIHSIEIQCSGAHLWWDLYTPFTIPIENHVCRRYQMIDKESLVAQLLAHRVKLYVYKDGSVRLDYMDHTAEVQMIPDKVVIGRHLSIFDDQDLEATSIPLIKEVNKSSHMAINEPNLTSEISSWIREAWEWATSGIRGFLLDVVIVLFSLLLLYGLILCINKRRESQTIAVIPPETIDLISHHPRRSEDARVTRL